MLTWWFCPGSRIAPMCLLGTRQAVQNRLCWYGLWGFSWSSLSAYRKSVAKKQDTHKHRSHLRRDVKVTGHKNYNSWSLYLYNVIRVQHSLISLLAFYSISQHIASKLHSTSWSHDNQWWSVFQFTYLNWTILQSNSQVGITCVNAIHPALELQDVFGSSTFHHVPAKLICFSPACLRKKKTSDKKSKWESILRTLRLKL